LRDLTERVVVASKGRFDRAIKPRERQALGLPHTSSMTRDDFMENTLDVWEIPPESATRVGHPAPFPIELPSRLIELYTYTGDLVLDPFLGSGTTAVAAVQTGRHYVGYDLDPAYVDAAERRVASAVRRAPVPAGQAVGEAVAAGRSASDIARIMVEAAGLTNVAADKRAVGADLTAVDSTGRRWLFLVAGGFTSHRPGMATADAVWKCVGRGAVLRERDGAPVVVLTADVPAPATALGQSLAAVTGPDRPLAAIVRLPGGVDDLRRLVRP
jgi:site-specific DNA-methyltransferase (adenine-specific)